MANALKVLPEDRTERDVARAERVDPSDRTPEDLISTLRLIFGYSEVLKHNLRSSFHLRASDDIEKINRVAWETLATWGQAVENRSPLPSRESFDAEHFMQALSHVVHVQMSRTCKSISYYVPQGFGTILGDEEALLDICLGGLDFLQGSVRPDRLSVHLYPSQVDGKDFINLDLRATAPHLSDKFDGSLSTFFHNRKQARIQKACDALGAKFHLDIATGHGLTFLVTFPDQRTRADFTNLSRRESLKPAIMLLGTDQRVERLMQGLAKESNLEILAVSQLRSGLRVYFEKQPGLVMIDANEDGWGASELIETVRGQSKNCFIVVLVRQGMADLTDFPGSDLILEQPFKVEDLLEHITTFDLHKRALAPWK